MSFETEIALYLVKFQGTHRTQRPMKAFLFVIVVLLLLLSISSSDLDHRNRKANTILIMANKWFMRVWVPFSFITIYPKFCHI